MRYQEQVFLTKKQLMPGLPATQEELSLMKSYKFRLYPTKKQVETLQWTLDRCRALYNAALQEHRDAYDRGVRQHPNYYDEDARKELSKKHAVGYNEQATQLAFDQGD
jgi:transposase